MTVPDIEKYALFYNKSKGQYDEEEFKRKYHRFIKSLQ